MELNDDRYVYHWTKKELSTQQDTFGVDFTRMRCEKGEEEECSIASDSTWSTASEVVSGRIIIACGEDRGHPAWQYVLLDDDAETSNTRLRERMLAIHNKYVRLWHCLEVRMGIDPPQDVKDWIAKYGCP